MAGIVRRRSGRAVTWARVGWHRVPLAALADSDRALVELEGRRIALFRVDSTVHAVANGCPHAGNPLLLGEVAGTTLTCAFHGWRFDLATGACLAGDEAVRRYATELRGDEVWLEVPPDASP